MTGGIGQAPVELLGWETELCADIRTEASATGVAWFPGVPGLLSCGSCPGLCVYVVHAVSISAFFFSLNLHVFVYVCVCVYTHTHNERLD